MSTDPVTIPVCFESDRSERSYDVIVGESLLPSLGPRTLQALGKRQGESCFYGVDTLERREQATGFLGAASTELVKDIAALVSFNLVLTITHPAHRSTSS